MRINFVEIGSTLIDMEHFSVMLQLDISMYNNTIF